MAQQPPVGQGFLSIEALTKPSPYLDTYRQITSAFRTSQRIAWVGMGVVGGCRNNLKKTTHSGNFPQCISIYLSC
jgi:hypothetical protein